MQKQFKKKAIIWIGPNAETIKSMGDKIESRKLISKAGLQPVPGQLKPSRTKERGIERCQQIWLSSCPKGSSRWWWERTDELLRMMLS